MKEKIKSIFRFALPCYRIIIKNVRYVTSYIQNLLLYVKFLNFIKESSNKNRIFYIGIAQESNLGDIAQTICITNWIKSNFENFELYMVGSGLPCDTRFKFIDVLKKNIREKDLIIFQSGYGVQDMGGNHNMMHCRLFSNIPDARYLMMPQTILFKTEERKKQTSLIYSLAKNMLFLARDTISYNRAVSMFNGPKVLLYPDIVTTMIGVYNPHNNGVRNGICICRRNDLEKYYDEESISNLANILIKKGYNVVVQDTTKKISWKKMVNNASYYVEKEIDDMSHFEVVITDRYHGTIFSLIAGTPVIVINSNDHKVTTGLDWFKGVYDEYIYHSMNLEQVPDIVDTVIQKKLDHIMRPYFQQQYYDKLKNSIVNNHE